ncbi:hypothetical protein ACODHD_05835 [Vagococcus fluvialis]|uniref:hypothetical protein n=1 Tax=Vagococcus fluvialis TaxID=2738 RepID=UPI003B20F2F2
MRKIEYMGEFNLLQWTGEYFIQIPSGLKEKGLEANNLMAIIRDVFTSKEISQLDEMESVSASFPLKKKTAKEVIGKIAKDAADEGLSFLVDTLIETTLDIDMGTDKKEVCLVSYSRWLWMRKKEATLLQLENMKKTNCFLKVLFQHQKSFKKYFILSMRLIFL